MKTRDLAYIALFAAITAVLGLVPAVQIGPVPITAQTLGVMLAGLTAILLVAAVVLSACLKEVPLRRVSAIQARAEAAAATGDAEVAAAQRDAEAEDHRGNATVKLGHVDPVTAELERQLDGDY